MDLHETYEILKTQIRPDLNSCSIERDPTHCRLKAVKKEIFFESNQEHDD